MKVGVTGSRQIRPPHTLEKLRSILIEKDATELHHGDCIGFDEQAANVAIGLGIKVVAHPPDNSNARAFAPYDEIMPAASYLDRNKNIVAAVDFLVAAPDGPERIRSGTWSTVRYAKKQGVKGVVLSWSEQNGTKTE